MMVGATSIWKDTVDRASAPVLIVGRDRTVRHANRAAYEFLDYPDHAITGLPLKWIAPGDADEALSHIDAIFAGETPRKLHGEALRADGSLVHVTMIFEPCLDQRGEVGAVSVRYQASAAEPATTVMRFKSVPLLGMPANQGKSAHQSGIVERAALQHDQDSAGEKLDSALQLMRWLAGRFTSPRDAEHGDDARERARMLLVLRDATELVHECRRELAESSGDHEVTVTAVVRR